MQIDQGLTDEAVLGELGERLARLRLQRNLTQRELAAEAGVDRKVVLRLEAGEPVQLVALVRVLRALGRLASLDVVLAPPQPSPMELLELHGRARQRARPPRRDAARSAPRRSSRSASADTQRPEGEQTEPWRWGDER